MNDRTIEVRCIGDAVPLRVPAEPVLQISVPGVGLLPDILLVIEPTTGMVVTRVGETVNLVRGPQ
jgi:hypothetical protein